MKPGPGDIDLGHFGRLRSFAAIISASSRGFLPASLASTIAALVAMSPWLASRGGSTTMRDRSGGAGKTPALASVVHGGADVFGEEMKDVHAAR